MANLKAVLLSVAFTGYPISSLVSLVTLWVTDRNTWLMLFAAKVQTNPLRAFPLYLQDYLVGSFPLVRDYLANPLMI